MSGASNLISRSGQSFNHREHHQLSQEDSGTLSSRHNGILDDQYARFARDALGLPAAAQIGGRS